MKLNSKKKLAGYEPALLEDWYRYNYFNSQIDISGSGVEEYTCQEIQSIADFSFSELNNVKLKDVETLGSLNLRSKLANLFGTGNPDMAIVTNGGNEALQLIARSLFKVNDEVITLGNCYHCHDKIAASMGCKVKKWELDPNSDFRIDINDLRELISPNTKAVVLNFPHNPTGKSISQDLLNSIIDLVEENDVYLIWDAVFQELTYENKPLIDPIHHYSKTITLGTFSKIYGAPGLRFGWIIGPEAIALSCARQRDYGNLYVSPITEFIANKMLQTLNRFSLPRINQASINLDIVDKWINSNDHALSWTKPNGGACGVIRLPENTDDLVFCINLLKKYGVLLVPGSCFDLPCFARLGFGGNTNELIQGLEGLNTFLTSE